MNKTGITLCTALCLSSFLAAAADPHKVKITPCAGASRRGYFLIFSLIRQFLTPLRLLFVG